MSESSAAASAASKGKTTSRTTAMIVVAIVVILIAAPLGYLLLTQNKNHGPGGEEVLVTVIGKQSEKNYTLSELKEMTYLEQASSYQNRFGNWRGDGTYRGVQLSSLADQVGGMVAGDIMTIEASDGYAQNLSYYQVYPDASNQAIQGKIVLGYMFNSSLVPDWADGPMIAVLAPDHAFSNDDLNQTVDRDPEFASSTSAGSLWVKNVDRIQIRSVFDEWTVQLTNLQSATTNLTRTKFVALGYDYYTYFVDSKSRNWSGVPASIILGYVDDNDTATFNATLAATEYRVNVSASDGYSNISVAKDLVDNEALFAYKMNGTVLSSSYAPLKLVGSSLAGSQMVSKIVSIKFLEPATAPPTEAPLVSVIEGSNTQNVTLTALLDMTSIQGVSSYQNRFGNWRGLGTYQGVTLQSLADLVGGMHPGDVMTVTATDGYWQNFSYYQVYADASYLAIQGNIILAYEFNGTPVPSWTDGPKIAVLAPDGAFSNGDFNATAARDPEFLGSTSASSLWVKNVNKIEISHVFDEWTVQLTNLQSATTNLTRTKFVALGYDHYTYFVDSKSRNWSGVPVSMILGYVDDSDQSSFNTSLADTQYRVNIAASDGYNKTMIAKDLVDGGALFAYKMNGTVLSSSYAPLKLVGASLAGSQMVSKITSVTFLPPEAQVLTLQNGGTFLNFTLSQLQSMDTVTSSGGFMKSTGTIVGPNEFTGVPVKDLVSLLFSGSNFSLEVVATDGYTMTYSSSQVINGTFEHYAMDGTLLGPGDFTFLLAWEQDGAPLTDMALRIAIVGDSAPITDGHFWAKYVRNITVKPFAKEWNIELSGLTNMTMDRQSFEAVASCPHHTLNYTFTNATGQHTYEGVALYILVAAVDGADAPDGHYLFNEVLADAGYNVSVTASDYYTIKLPISVVRGNASIIVANKLDGEPLPDSEFPLKLVGPWLTGGQKVKMIAKITLTDMNAVPHWNLTIVGTQNVTIDSMAFDALYHCGVHAGTYTFTNGTGTHTYEGIPLWVLVGAVDGQDPPDHYEFNTTLAALGYSVRIIASDGSNVTLPISQIALNDTLILAYMLDGQPLTGNSAPLILVGPGLPDSQSIMNVIRIELVGLPT
jgi:DMSO/TMAO reductase YedYZ molybdopterin-dependent catalytic subunit